MAVGDRPVRSAARRDAVVAEQGSQSPGALCERPSATGQAARRGGSFAPRINWGPPQAGIKSPPRAPFHDRGRSACGALHPQIGFGGANRSCPVVTFSPVKQVDINAGWYDRSPVAASRPTMPQRWPPVLPLHRRVGGDRGGDPARGSCRLDPPGALDPVSWHGHEMIFVAAAAIGGFILTALREMVINRT